MTTAHRRPRLLHLVLPHPALDQASSPSTPVASPHTPRRPPKPETGHTRSSMASDRPPRSSIDSWNSVDTNELAWEWKDQELELLSKTLDNIPSHLMTPFVGVIPPPNVLDKLARNIALSRTALEWPHSVRATRVKLHELSRRKTVQKAIERHAPVMRTEVEPRRPLYRQSSMDFLPVKNEATSVTRLSSRLQRTDRTAHASFHPYARPSSRSPTPPLETLSRSITPEPRAPSPRKLFRSSATPPPQTLKRTPSYSATKSRAPESPSYSSDEEEKARQATAKRPRTTRRVPSFLGAPLPALAPSPEEEILDPLVGGPEDLVFAPTIPPVKRKSLPPPPRARPAPRPSVPTPRSSAPTRPSASTARPSAPVVRPTPAVRPSVPATRPTAPPTPAPAPAPTTPRTLRRIGTRNFPPPASVAALARAMAPAPAVEPQPRRVSAPRPLAQPRRVSSTAQTSEPRRERKREDKDSKPKPKKSPEHLASMRL